MSEHELFTQRRNLLKGIGSAGALMLAGCSKTDPPTYGNLLRMGDNLTYKAHRLLLDQQALVREYDLGDLSPMVATGSTNPADPARSSYHPEYGPAYEQLLADEFANWRLKVTGLVAKPSDFSLPELKRLTARTQITRHTCEEGWSAIAQWTGVPLRHLLHAVGVSPSARFVQLRSYDGWADGIDMVDALHPQTILAYGMNGRDLPLSHGAPLRLRLETQMGYKSMKYLREIVVTDTFDDGGVYGNIQNGWSWYAGI
jgi:DMSO/TMAO reductase YedYZ molybdopterin-dependent catalytic subunit